MTKASREGRRLRLEVDDIERPFLVDPISAHRGRYLTDLFILAALGSMSVAQTESIFIESLGPANYSRAAGFLVDQYEDDEPNLGRYRCTFGPDGRLDDAPRKPDLEEGDSLRGLRYIAQTPLPEELVDPLNTLRQEEVESLALIAFYWQTVAGMEAVEAFIEAGEGTRGSLKAMSLLQFRLGVSPSRTSPSSALESRMKQADIPATSTPNGGATLAVLPAMQHSPEPQNAKKGRAFFRR